MTKIDKNSQKIKKTKQEKNKIKKNSKRSNINRFFENEAEVGSDDSEDYGSNNKPGVKKNYSDHYYKKEDLK